MDTTERLVRVIEEMIDRKLSLAGIPVCDEGIIKSKVDDSVYETLIRGVTYTLKSAAGYPLNIGDRVMTVGTARKKVIIGRMGDESIGGEKGDKGDPGKSAYQIAVDNGFVGTETEWLESLHAETGFEFYLHPGVYSPGKLIPISAYNDLVDSGDVDPATTYLLYSYDSHAEDPNYLTGAQVRALVTDMINTALGGQNN